MYLFFFLDIPQKNNFLDIPQKNIFRGKGPIKKKSPEKVHTTLNQAELEGTLHIDVLNRIELTVQLLKAKQKVLIQSIHIENNLKSYFSHCPYSSPSKL